MSVREFFNRRRALDPAIVIGVGSAIVCRIFVPTNLSIEVYRWTYSTIMQAFAAMVALLCMVAIYRLQLLRGTLETDLQKLELAVQELDARKEEFEPPVGIPVRRSSDFVDDKEFQQRIMKVVERDMKWINNAKKEIHKRGEHVPSKDGHSKRWEAASRDDAHQLAK